MRLVFMGTPQAAVPTLEKLINEGHDVVAVYTQPDRPAGRGNKLASPAVKQFAVGSGLNVLQPSKIRTQEAFDIFKSHRADAAVVVAYGRILPDTFLTAFPRGAINVHFSLLPKYRGAAPVNWAIVNGETETGITTMQMDSGLDTGDILMQHNVGIGKQETAVELMSRLSFFGADLLSETLQRLDRLEPRKQDETAATLAPILKREDGLLSWMLTARDIVNRIRGFQPFPSAFIFLEGKRLTLWKAAVAETNGHLGRPGEILEASGDELMIFCGGDSVLRIEELQLEGKKRMPVRDFLNGIKLRKGRILE